MKWQNAGLAFVGCMFIGGGIGAALHEQEAGWLIGMGAGFLAMVVIGMLRR